MVNKIFVINKQCVKSQSGAALIVSMIVLIVVTLLGITAMNGTVLTEKMSRNYRDSNVAYQAAELALRDAETWLESQATAPMPTSTGANRVWSLGAIAAANPGSWWEQPNAWWSANGVQYVTATLSGIPNSERPRTIIEFKVIGSGGGGGSIVGGGSGGGSGGGGTVMYYQITARGVAGNGQAQIILQSIYSKEF